LERQNDQTKCALKKEKEHNNKSTWFKNGKLKKELAVIKERKPQKTSPTKMKFL